MEEAKPVTGKEFNINDIRNIIPHRYPFLLVDKVVIIEEMKKGVGYKCVSGNEDYFQGHFPGNPVMPNLLILEARAQTAAVIILSLPQFTGKLAYFITIDAVKFMKLVVPGDVLELRIEALRIKAIYGKIRGKAYINNILTAEAEFTFVMAKKETVK